MLRPNHPSSRRRAAVAITVAILLVVILGMVAFAVDIGYILVVRAEAQNAADAAALAGMSRLAEQLKRAPLTPTGPTQTEYDLRLAREEAREYARKNLVGGYEGDLQDVDIEIGYLANPYDRSNNQTLDTSGWPARPYNAVRVTLRRQEGRNGGPVKLFFAPVLGMSHTDVDATATAVFAMGMMTPKGSQGGKSGGLLPFTYQVDDWNAAVSRTTAGTFTGTTGTITVTDSHSVSYTYPVTLSHLDFLRGRGCSREATLVRTVWK